jgi:hypothetical protein
LSSPLPALSPRSKASIIPPGGCWQEANYFIEWIKASKFPSNQFSDSGAWSAETLHLTGKVANDFIQEVAEWSVLYAKELPEP